MAYRREHMYYDEPEVYYDGDLGKVQYDAPYGEDYEHLTPNEMKKLKKGKFYICDEFGNCVKVVKNHYPGQAAQKGANLGLFKMLIWSPNKNRWYAYIGHRIKIRPQDLTPHQVAYGINHKAKVYRQHWTEDEAQDYLNQLFV